MQSMSPRDPLLQNENKSMSKQSSEGTKKVVPESGGSPVGPLGVAWKEWAIGVGVSLMAGVGFGFAMQKAQVYDPETVREQFGYKNWIMVKMFAAALSMSLLSLSAISLVAPSRFGKAMKGAWTNDRGTVSAFLGGVMIGTGGFVLAGSCPGTVWAQLGAGVTTAPLTFAGAVVGALLYGAVHPYLSGAARGQARGSRGAGDEEAGEGQEEAVAPFNFLTWGQPTIPTLDKALGVPYVALALPMGVMIGVLAVVLEIVVPAADDLLPGTSVNDGNVFTSTAWPATAAGSVIGAMQIPMVLLAGKTLGASTSFVIILSSLLHIVLPERFMEAPALGYFKAKHALTKTGFQMFFVLAVIIGSLVSATASSTHGDVHGVRGYQAFLGGAIMLFGARLGGGCTSGHGLSGVAKLQFASFASVVGMFGAGSGMGVVWFYG